MLFKEFSVGQVLKVGPVTAEDSESMGSPGMSYLKWPTAVRPGDTLRLEAHVLDASLSKSGRVGVLQWRWLLINQADEAVLDLQATSLFDLSRRRE